MKMLLPILIFALVASLRAATADPAVGLVGHFTFDEGQLDEREEGAVNSVPGGPCGTITVDPASPGSISASPKGVIGGSAAVVRSSAIQFKSNPDFANFGDGSFTVSGWFQSNLPPDAKTKLRALIGKGRANQDTPGWAVFLRFDEVADKVQLAFAATDGTRTGLALNQPIPEFELGKWYHMAAVVDREAEVVHLYLNGFQIGRRPLGEVRSLDTPEPLIIARWANAVVPYDGMLDDFGLWSRALSEAEIADIYNGGLKGVPLAGAPTKPAGKP